jgi:antitoxin HigA-1
MLAIAHPVRLLKRELKAHGLSANRLALDLGVRSGRITDILNGRRSITADTAVRLGRYFGNRAQFWLDLQSSTISRWSSATAAKKSPAGSIPPTRPEQPLGHVVSASLSSSARGKRMNSGTVGAASPLSRRHEISAK